LITSVVLIISSRYLNDKFLDSLTKIGLKTKDQVSKIDGNYYSVKIRHPLCLSDLNASENGCNFVIGYEPLGSINTLNAIYK
jgi:hypothetical protein